MANRREVISTASDQYPRLLVLTGSVPGQDGVGAILVRQILEELPRDQLKILAFTPRSVSAPTPNAYSWIDVILIRRYETAFRPISGILGDLVSWLAQKTVGKKYLQQLANRCIHEGKAFKCEVVFAVMDNPSVIRIAEQVSKSLQVPLIVFVMDHPTLQAHDFYYGRFLRAGLLKAFDRAMRHAGRIAVAGETMQQAYKERYGKLGSILRQGQPYVTPDGEGTPRRQEDDVLRIGFAGSLTARDAYDELIAELDRRQWRLAGKPVILRIIGSYLKLVPTAPQHIEYFGWRSISEMICLTEECDFLYLPQSFSYNLREFTRLSFPNKLCTYLPARRPIMLHAPEYASLHTFFGNYPCGPCSRELAAASLLDLVSDATTDRTVYQRYLDAVEMAFRIELNNERLRDGVREFLNLPFNGKPAASAELT